MNKKTKTIITNTIYAILILVLLIPQSRVYVLRLISFSPKIINLDTRETIKDYNINLKGINTSDINFKSVKGKVAIVNLWATWCTPCVAEMPSLQYLYNDYKDKVVFICITTDKKSIVQPFMEKYQFDLPVYNNTDNLISELESRTIPKTFLINKKGEIIIKAGRADWNTAKIRKLIDKLILE